ncbi:MAG: hypothetical protein DLM70_18680 [Chloroflexi bacterium]|nr:MAG: hypothetical protein DLM70_18680 [Chloroflexota bacterium]
MHTIEARCVRLPRFFRPFLDASFWIYAAHGGLVPYLTEYFSLTVPPRVAAELSALLGRIR